MCRQPFRVAAPPKCISPRVLSFFRFESTTGKMLTSCMLPCASSSEPVRLLFLCSDAFGCPGRSPLRNRGKVGKMPPRVTKSGRLFPRKTRVDAMGTAPCKFEPMTAQAWMDHGRKRSPSKADDTIVFALTGKPRRSARHGAAPSCACFGRIRMGRKLPAMNRP